MGTFRKTAQIAQLTGSDSNFFDDPTMNHSDKQNTDYQHPVFNPTFAQVNSQMSEESMLVEAFAPPLVHDDELPNVHPHVGGDTISMRLVSSPVPDDCPSLVTEKGKFKEEVGVTNAIDFQVVPHGDGLNLAVFQDGFDATKTQESTSMYPDKQCNPGTLSRKKSPLPKGF